MSLNNSCLTNYNRNYHCNECSICHNSKQWCCCNHFQIDNLTYKYHFHCNKYMISSLSCHCDFWKHSCHCWIYQFRLTLRFHLLCLLINCLLPLNFQNYNCHIFLNEKYRWNRHGYKLVLHHKESVSIIHVTSGHLRNNARKRYIHDIRG